MTLVIATHNSGKVRELSAMLRAWKIACLSLDEAGVTETVPETGSTFHENAQLKAAAYARLTGCWTLADDSGLEVDALEGAPGVYTQRFGGEGLSQPERNQLLLDQVNARPHAPRTARFRCVVALADPAGVVVEVAEGVCEGEVARAPAGDGGFGYDPIFYLPEAGATMAQLPAEEKARLSHRGRALRAIAPRLAQHLNRPAPGAFTASPENAG